MTSRATNPARARFLSLLLSFALFSLFSSSAHASSPVATSNDTLLWGPYRPNLYFGVRPRLPNSLLTGLLWANTDNYATVQQNFRHTCEQNEGMAGYGWEEYDARNGGREVIHDTGNKIDLTIDFVKVSGGQHGGSWAARIKGTPREDAPSNLVTTLVFYAGLEGLGELGFTAEEPDSEGAVTLHGEAIDLGEFDITFKEPSENTLPYRTHASWDAKPLDRMLMCSVPIPPEAAWQAKNIVFASMKQEIDVQVQEYGQQNMPPPWAAFTIPQKPGPGNFHMVQKLFVGSFEFDILFNSASGPSVSTETVDKAIAATSDKFKARFKEVFTPLAPFTKPAYTAFAESMFSNLYGGIGYFYGDSLVDRSYAPEYDEENEGFWEETAEARARAEIVNDPPAELFTSVPSRPFFPRGFLWDEGFHLVPIVEWDLDITLDIVKSWFNLMDEDGWIAREQILGPEARSKVPEEFQVQYPHYANPPTLFLIIDILMDKLSDTAPGAQKERIESELRTLYPLLKRQYYWFRRTQFGDIKSYDRKAFSTKEAYRWRGRTPRHILPSGLDDYPRPQPPHPGELHTDLISWVGLMSRTLLRLATVLSETDDASDFQAQSTAIVRNIDDLHWSAEAEAYCDATIDDYEESTHVCHKGYISLFPFLTGLLPPTHPNLPHILALISSESELWSPYGVRSLSRSDEFYGTDENYWRSPIWVNMNYLILKNLLVVAQSPSAPSKVKTQAARIYTELRQNLVQNVFNEWERTGFAWEQYNPDSGAGQRTQHFTGWTSLVVVIMRMPDLSIQAGIKHGEL
ncbi:mannosyl-oligosaccharide glucosidase [Capronia epimyces CBS 606.96]|uniref:Mannosyl-oligosaccharide glucosidase n=1 Tax=Capronia epimyces CBS 606.96 TaxID=1182542 RepID=W9YJP8_9EURO|nr:mannosyl-oligosaccharide glucosidase [Capronia epimyces CBS 606.96]EXJ93132.1 mannosyl-oligosaccharide glucosidase [Capronia epimyces CBS 606.96]